MSTIDEKEARAHRRRVRTKLFNSMLVAYGYALLAGALWEPLTKGQPFTPAKIGLTALALAMHGFALYIAPDGEPK